MECIGQREKKDKKKMLQANKKRKGRYKAFKRKNGRIQRQPGAKKISNYSFKNPSPSYKLTGVAHVTPSPNPLPVGVVIPRRADVGVGGAR